MLRIQTFLPIAIVFSEKIRRGGGRIGPSLGVQSLRKPGVNKVKIYIKIYLENFARHSKE